MFSRYAAASNSVIKWAGDARPSWLVLHNGELRSLEADANSGQHPERGEVRGLVLHPLATLLVLI